jgi:hypothetical protein
MWEKRNAYRISVGNAEENISLERPRCIWEDDVKIGLREREDRVLRTGFIWLTIGIISGLL